LTESPRGDEILEQLVALARTERPEVSWRERKDIERIDELLVERRAARSLARRRTTVGLSLAAVCSLLAGLLLYLSAPRSLSYEVAGAVVNGGYIEGQNGARVDFSDGSRLELAQGTRARVSELSAHGSRVELDQGHASLSVVKSAQTAWSVQAGPYAVKVTGTAFDVRWSKQERRFELELHHGSVVITGPGIERAVGLEAGQRFVGTPAAPARVESQRVASLAPSPEPLGSAPSGLPETPARDAKAASGAAVSPAELGRAPEGSVSWPRLVAQGKFQQVIDGARSRGMSEVLSSASLSDLTALADAARYARSSEVARETLLGVRRRFPNSRPSRDAAFFLGGLSESKPAAALEWYERYMSESPNGAYMSQALGRRLMLVYQLRGSEGAAPLARQYLERFANGPYAASARKMLGRPSP
jgi:hypothetical protein